MQAGDQCGLGLVSRASEKTAVVTEAASWRALDQAPGGPG